jgi:hypothetical protein
MRTVVTALVVAGVVAVGAAGLALANADDEPPPRPEEEAVGTSNTADPDAVSDYWTEERQRAATGG